MPTLRRASTPMSGALPLLLGALLLIGFGGPRAAGAAAEDCPECTAFYGLQPHKLNYALVLVHDGVRPPGARESDGITLPPDNRLADEAKFQISLKARLPGGPPWYLGYTQKSFWQIYDGPHSRPFRESNYNPELFMDWNGPLGLRPEWTLRYGLEHESNGQTIERSRSWNRAYLWPRFEADRYSLSLKVWQRFPEDEKESPTDTQGDENRQIVDYLGRFEAYAAWTPFSGLDLSAMVRKGTLDPSGTYELNAFTDLGQGWRSFRLMAQYFSGYGESLFDYNHRVDKVGVGFGFW